MAFYSSAAFWLIIIGIILIAIGFAIYASNRNAGLPASTWSWLTWGLGAVLLIAGVVWWIFGRRPVATTFTPVTTTVTAPATIPGTGIVRTPYTTTYASRTL